MKNLSFVLLSALLFFSSCSSNDDIINNGNEINTSDTTKYAVTFNVKSSGFEVDKTPLKSTEFGSTYFLQVIVYNETGTVYSDSVIYADSLKKLIQDDNSVPFTLNLPAGNYNLALFSAPLGWLEGSYKYYIIHPKNYNTDEYSYESPNTTSVYSNQGLYYQTLALTVSSTGNNLSSNNLILDPMWSEVNITVTGLKNAKLPEGTSYISILCHNNNRGFGIKSKLATKSMQPILPPIAPIGAIKLDGTDSASSTFCPAKGNDLSMGFTLEFIKADDKLLRYITLGYKEFLFENKFENGKRYVISGNIGNINLADPSFAITINDLSSESINIPFE